MKSKKGFTLVEIIVCLVLIVVIGTVSFISIKLSDKNNEEKVKIEFNNSVKLASNIFVETNQDVKKFASLKNSGDYVYIQLKDLVGIGLLDENDVNPYIDKSLKERNCDIVKIFLDQYNAISIEYPVKIFDGLSCDDVEEKINSKYEIYLKNEDIYTKAYMDTSDIIWGKYVMEGLTFNDIKYGDYYKDKYQIVKESYVLRDYETETVISINENDWDNSCEFIKGTTSSLPYWECTYKLKETSPYYNRLYTNEPVKRKVTLVDDSAPILIEPVNKYGVYEAFTYDIDNNGTFTNVYRFENFILEPRLIDCYTGASYYVGFDNWDGNIDYDGTSSKFTINNTKGVIQLADSYGNKSNYTAQYDESYIAPQIVYSGDSNITSKDYLSSIFDKITVTYENEKHTKNIYEIELSNVYEGVTSKDSNREEKLRSLSNGTYNLSVFAYDGYTCESFNTTIQINIPAITYYCPEGELIGDQCYKTADERPSLDCKDITGLVTDESICGCAVTNYDVCVSSCYSSGWSNPEDCVNACWIGPGGCNTPNTCETVVDTQCDQIGVYYVCDYGWNLVEPSSCYKNAQVKE